MAFQFALQPVLRLRENLERLERLRLALLLGYLNKVNQQCSRLDNERREVLAAARDRLQSGMSAMEIRFEHARAAVLERNRNNLLIQKARLEQERAAQERVLKEARRRRKTIENLRNRKLELYDQNERRTEQQRLDEMHAARGTNRP